MPDYSRYPNAQDVEVLLKSASFWPTGAENSAGVLYAQEEAAVGIRAAIDEFEVRTGWVPFFQPETAATTRTITADATRFGRTGTVSLGGGLLRLDSVSIEGQNVELAKVHALPSDSIAKKSAYMFLRFPYYSRYAMAISDTLLRIEVTGRWGYAPTVPADAWQEILQYGAVKTLSQIENNQSIASLSQDGFSKAWDIVGTITQKDLLGEWGKRFDRACERYRRVVS